MLLFQKLKLVRENERLRCENESLREQVSTLLVYRQRMEQEWKNWWGYNGTNQKEDYP